MEPTFRQSMNWLHTWAGVVLGGLLFAIFWMGTLAVFDREIDRWMMPMTRLTIPETHISFDALRPSYEAAVKARAPVWSVILPTEREPVLWLAYNDASGQVRQFVDPSTGAALPDPGTWAGTRFIYPFHYMLHIRFQQIGIWLVGLASMAMLVLCISGVVIHRKIFADFFTFRPRKQPRRMLLDLHNVTGVLGLPFHVVITLSGLIIFWSIYFPSGWQMAYPNQQTLNVEAFGIYARSKLNKPGELGSLDAMVAETQRLWSGDTPSSIQVRHPGDAGAYVRIARLGTNRVTRLTDVASFDAATGALLHHSVARRPVMNAQRFIAGLHQIQFRHWMLRWVYFVLGLSGCVMIAAGYLYWLDARRKKHQQQGLSGVCVVEVLTIGSTTGIIAATLAFFVANRLLPLGTTFAGYERAALEAWAFYLVWLATFSHAWLRPSRAWIEQCWGVAVFAVAAVALNWITTGDYLVRSLAHRHLWPIAGMDMMLLVAAVIAALAARKLQRRAAGASAGAANVHSAELHPAE
jgi:uncharacterized iron-regulated membrane protein